MRLLFTRSNKLGSRLICWLTGEPVSHCAVEFERVAVAHSVGVGVSLDYAQEFRRTHYVGLELAPRSEMSHDEEMALFDHVDEQYAGAKYDWTALLYFGWRLFLRRFFGTELPKLNAADRPHAYFCSEFLLLLLRGEENALITPYQLYWKLKNSGEWV